MPCAAVSTWPRITSSTSPASTFARFMAALMATAPSSCAGMFANEPLKDPTAVRAAPTMTTSVEAMVLSSFRPKMGSAGFSGCGLRVNGVGRPRAKASKRASNDRSIGFRGKDVKQSLACSAQCSQAVTAGAAADKFGSNLPFGCPEPYPSRRLTSQGRHALPAFPKSRLLPTARHHGEREAADDHQEVRQSAPLSHGHLHLRDAGGPGPDGAARERTSSSTTPRPARTSPARSSPRSSSRRRASRARTPSCRSPSCANSSASTAIVCRRWCRAIFEFSIENLAKDHEKFREQLSKTFGPTAAFQALQDQVHANMAMFQEALRLFVPFTPGQAGERPRPTRKPPTRKPPTRKPRATRRWRTSSGR